MAKYEHIVTNEESGLTINQILRANYKFSSRFRTKMKYQSLVDLNGEPAPGYIRPETGDVIGVRLPEESSDFPAENIPLDVVYEDDDLLLVNKQPGVTVHPTKGHPEHTIANAVMYYMQQTDQVFKVRFANRIDMDTTGIIIVAKNANAQNDLSDQMRHNSVIKRYYALVEGNIEQDHFTVDLPIGRPDQISIRRTVMFEGGKDALTEVKVIKRFESEQYGPHTLVEVILHTGRTHQIRVHLSHIGHVIAGDELYGGSTALIGRQALHAYHIEFAHPVTHKHMAFDADMPEDIKRALSLLE